MISLTAPFENPVTTTLLRNPDLGNDEALNVVADHRRSINGKRYSYVKSSETRILNFTFNKVDRLKALEVIEFVKSYLGFNVKMVDHRGRNWKGILEPVEITTGDPYSACAEGCSFTLKFTGTLLINDTSTCNKNRLDVGLLTTPTVEATGEIA